MEVIEENNLSVAWAKGFIKLMSAKNGIVNPLITIINNINNNIQEDDKIRKVLDNELKNKNVSCNETVAGTIFPQSLWNRKKKRVILFQRYNNIWQLIKKCQKNRRGTYFNRLISYNGDNKKQPINQLEHIINTWNNGNHRHSALQGAIFDPREDHTNSQRLGFPCLQQIDFQPLGNNGREGICVTAFYPTQYMFEKAYGNYLGICRLGFFMAKEMNLKLNKMICIASAEKLGNINKIALKDLEKKLKEII